MLNDDIVGEETRNDRRKHKPRVTGGSQWESGATAVPLFRFILLFHEMCFQLYFVLTVFFCLGTQPSHLLRELNI